MLYSVVLKMYNIPLDLSMSASPVTDTENKFSENTFFPLSHAQRRMLNAERRFPGTSIFNVDGVLKIKGRLNAELLTRCIRIMVEEHSAFRLCFKRIDNRSGQVFQYVRDTASGSVEIEDICLDVKRQSSILSEIKTDFTRHISLFDDNLFNLKIILISDQESYLYAKIHHAICDGYSFELIVRELLRIYIEYLQTDNYESSNSSNYIDFVNAERKYTGEKSIVVSDSAEMDLKQLNKTHRSETFWNSMWHSVPLTHLRKRPINTQGKSYLHRLSQQQTKKLESFVSQHKISFNTLFISLALCYLYQLKGSTDVSVGTCILNRLTKEEKNIVGQLNSEMPFRTQIYLDTDFSSFVKQLHRQLKKCFCYQRYPIDMMAKGEKVHEQGYMNLFEMCVNYYNIMQSTNLGVFEVDYGEMFNNAMLHRVQLNIKKIDGDDGINVFINYNVNDFSTDDLRRLYQFINNMVELIDFDNSFKLTQLPEL